MTGARSPELLPRGETAAARRGANRLVITVTAQKLICPHTSEYPMKAVAITRRRISTPRIHSTSRGAL